MTQISLNELQKCIEMIFSSFEFCIICSLTSAHKITKYTMYIITYVQIPLFAITNSFSAVSGALCPDLTFCASWLILGSFGTVVASFQFRALRLILGDSEGVVVRFHILSTWSHFWRFQKRWIDIEHFAYPDSLWAVSGPSCPGFTFCAHILIFLAVPGALH
jgi:hypothetical protein